MGFLFGVAMNLRVGFVGVLALAILHAWPGSAAAQSGVTTYTYDALGQLVSSTNPTGQTTTYTYDQAGNRLSSGSVPPAPTVGDVNLTASFDYMGSAALTPSGAYTSLAVASAPAHGSTSISGTTATYTPTNNYYGSDSFTYTATGPGGTSNPATVSVNVPQPPPPTAGNVSLNVAYNTSGSVTLTPGPYTSHVVLASNPSHGSASNTWTTATYTPTSGYSGSDSFTYTASGAGGTSSPATVSVTVAAPAAPTVGNVNLTAGFDYQGSATLKPTGAYTSLAVASAPAHGSASISGTTATYTPTNNYYGSDSFTYTATGPAGTSNPATVSVTVPQPPAPTAGNVSLSVAYNTSSSVTLTPGAYASHLALASNPSHGSAAIVGWPTATYTPTSGYYGSDSFTYTASGAGGTGSPATVSVTVAAPAAPTVGNVNLTAGFDYQGSATLTPAGAYTSLAVASAPAHGSASISGTTATYTPANNYYGSDSFTYTATGPAGTSNPATVSVTVPQPPAPTAGNVSLSVAYNTSSSVTLTPGAYASRLALASNPSHGSAAIVGWPTATYTPTSGYYGSDSFTYTASGAGGTGSPATVSVTVVAPAAPTAPSFSLTVPYYSVGASAVTPGGIFNIGSLAVVSQPTHGTVRITVNSATQATFYYSANSGYVGTDSFSYTVSGPGGTSAPGTASITVNPPAAPTAGAVSLTVGYNASGSVALAPNGVYSSVAIASNPSPGTVSISGTTATYTPQTGYSGADSFTYTASGLGGTSSPGTVSVNVLAPGALSTSLNGTSWSNLASSSNIVVTPIGGVPGYTYAWTKVSGSALIAISSANAQSVYWTKSTTLNNGVEYDSVWQCVVTDSAGNTYTTPQVSVSWTDSE